MSLPNRTSTVVPLEPAGAPTPAREPCPAWLAAVPAGAHRIDSEDFFASRVVLYPGAGSDGHPLLVFGRPHAAHCFLYVDQSYTRERLSDTLDGRRRGYDARVRGYHTHARIELDVQDVIDADFDTALPERSTWRFGIHARPMDALLEGARVNRVPSLALLEVLERDAELDDGHGPERLAILFVAADAYDVFEAVFVRRRRAPYAIVLQDHGFGGNHDRFCAGGRLDQLATDDARPRWLVAAANTAAWDDYDDVGPCGRGGMYWNQRSLFVRRRGPHGRLLRASRR